MTVDNGGYFPHNIVTMENLLHDIERFCGANALSDGQFGLAALNDKNFVQQLRDGRDIRFSTAEKVRHFMLTYKPTTTGEAA